MGCWEEECVDGSLKEKQIDVLAVVYLLFQSIDLRGGEDQKTLLYINIVVDFLL